MSKKDIRKDTDKRTLNKLWPNGLPDEDYLTNMLLKDSAGYLEGNWIVGDWENEQGAVCSIGAIDHVYNEKKMYPRRIYLAAKAKLANAIEGGKGLFSADSDEEEIDNTIMEFNDAEDIDYGGEKIVLSKFRAAIRRKR